MNHHFSLRYDDTEAIGQEQTGETRSLGGNTSLVAIQMVIDSIYPHIVDLSSYDNPYTAPSGYRALQKFYKPVATFGKSIGNTG